LRLAEWFEDCTVEIDAFTALRNHDELQRPQRESPAFTHFISHTSMKSLSLPALLGIRTLLFDTLFSPPFCIHHVRPRKEEGATQWVLRRFNYGGDETAIEHEEEAFNLPESMFDAWVDWAFLSTTSSF
jgi:hypothetical protein